MKINAINTQNFGNKKFRIPVRMVKENADPISAVSQYYPKDTFIKGNCVKEYSNPKAEEFFYKALEATNIDETLNYLQMMGDDISAEQQINKFLESEMP